MNRSLCNIIMLYEYNTSYSLNGQRIQIIHSWICVMHIFTIQENTFKINTVKQIYYFCSR